MRLSRILSLALLAACLVAAGAFAAGTAEAASDAPYAAKDMKRLAKTLNEACRTLSSNELFSEERPFDPKAKPLSAEEVATLAIYHAYNFGKAGVRHVENGTPLDIYGEGEKMDSYCLVSLDAARGMLEATFGLGAQMPQASGARYFNYPLVDGSVAIGESDACYVPEIRIASARRDAGDGTLVHLSCTQKDEEGGTHRYSALVRETMRDGALSWQLISLAHVGR